jgi:hypothetical protein
MNKFGRNYRLTIENFQSTLCINPDAGDAPEATTVIEFPITCEFTIKRGGSSTLNSMDINLYNLDKTTRDNIFQDRGNFFSDGRGSVVRRFIKMEAGYGDNLYTVFQGNIFEAGSTRRGADVITYINARDGGYDTNLVQAFKTIVPPVSKKELLEILTAQFPYLKAGAIADDGISFTRAVSVNGNVYENMIVYGGKNLYIDLEKVYYLRDFEVIEEQELVIDAATGILETPNSQDAGIFVKTLFEPQAVIGRTAQVRSLVNPRYDGRYKILQIHHKCVMSGAVGGECSTTLGMIVEGKVFGRAFASVPYTQTRTQ